MIMIVFINRKKARKYIKQAFDAHRRLMMGKYENYEDRLKDIERFSEAIANLAWMTGASRGITPPDLWKDV